MRYHHFPEKEVPEVEVRKGRKQQRKDRGRSKKTRKGRKKKKHTWGKH